MADYAHPEALVSTQWVAERASDPAVRIVEVDVDTKAYEEAMCPALSHGPGTVSFVTPFDATFCRKASSNN